MSHSPDPTASTASSASPGLEAPLSLKNNDGKVTKAKAAAGKRKYHTKSRKGCNTCKRRRVKCDEGKPICKKCDNMGIECTYSEVALGRAAPGHPDGAVASSSSNNDNNFLGANHAGGDDSSCSSSPAADTKPSLPNIGANPFGHNLNSSITSAALQLLIANATNSVSSAPSNNPLAALLSSNKSILDLVPVPGNGGANSGVGANANNHNVSHNSNSASINSGSNGVSSSGIPGGISASLLSNDSLSSILSAGTNSTNNGLSTAELLLLQQQQQQQMQQALLLNLMTGNNGNSTNSSNAVNSSSNANNSDTPGNPLASLLSSLSSGNSAAAAAAATASSAASLLNLANSNELYPGLNTLASQAEQQKRSTSNTPLASRQNRALSSHHHHNNNVFSPASPTTANSSMHHLMSPSPRSPAQVHHTDGHSNNRHNSLLTSDTLTVPEDSKNMISTPSSTSSSMRIGASDNGTSATSSPSSPKSSLLTSSSYNFTTLDLRLIHHYTTQVWPTITAAGISEEKLWSEYIPKLAFSHPFLMHSVLAFSATHLSRTENGLDECVTTHRVEALRLLRDAVLEISLENTDALVASAIILIMDALANASLPSSPSPKSLPASAWIYHVKGAATILTAVWPLNKTSKFHKFISVDLSDLGDIINSSEKLAVNDKTYSDLQCFDDSIADLYPVEYSSPYLITLAYLDKLHNERYKSDFILRIFAFPALLDKTFLALLMTGDVAAMRIMRVYYSMLREFTNEMRDKVWFLEGVCKVLPADVDKYSGGGGMHMMLDFLGGGLPSLTTVNLSDDFASNLDNGFMSN